MDNYNVKVRNIIENWVKIGAQLGVDARTFLENNIENIYDYFNEENEMNKIAITYLLEVAYLDAYKMYSYLQKECLNDDIQEDTFGLIYDIESFDDLFNCVSEEPKFFAKILFASYKFSTLTYLGKSIIMKSLTNMEDYFLNDLFPIHQQDIDMYKKEVDITTIINYINEKTEYQHKIMQIDFREGIISNLLGYIRNLIKLDYDNAISLLMEIAKIDYAASKYILPKIKSQIEMASFIEHIDLYENYNLDDILARLICDSDFLKDAIWMLASVFVYNSYNDITINPKLLENNEVQQVTKKFVFNNNFNNDSAK